MNRRSLTLLGAAATPVLAAAAASTLLATPAAGTAAAPTGPAAPVVTLPRPAADHPDLRGATAPVRGTVPGLTGAAAVAAAGPAADRFRAVRLAASAGVARPADTLHTDWGVFLPNSMSSGLQVTQSVLPGVTTQGSNDWLYAPTALSAGKACIEMTTAYTPTGPKLWAWDWCTTDTVGKLVNLDSDFLSTYTTTVNGLPAYSMNQTLSNASANTWTASLFNYRTHAWDTFYTSSGTQDLNFAFGWDTYEVYTDSGFFCTATAGKTVESSDIRLWINGAWTPATPTTAPLSSSPPPGSSFRCPSLRLAMVTPNSDWTARN
ncbi:MAG: carbohydrate-binding protein [Mycobacteriales bacterium]